jgi:hypothetical protein
MQPETNITAPATAADLMVLRTRRPPVSGLGLPRAVQPRIGRHFALHEDKAEHAPRRMIFDRATEPVHAWRIEPDLDLASRPGWQSQQLPRAAALNVDGVIAVILVRDIEFQHPTSLHGNNGWIPKQFVSRHSHASPHNTVIAHACSNHPAGRE